MEHNSLVDPKIAPAEIVATGEVAFPYDRLMTSSRQVKNIDPTIMQMTPSSAEAMALNYPSPSQSLSSTSNSQDDQTAYTKPKSKNSISIHRRRPGRPSKVQLEARKGNHPTGRKLALIKRQVHNDSAMRSRARFNTVLDELWEQVPECERPQTPGKADPSRSVHRAEKIEIAILYLRKLRRSVRMNECINRERIYGVHGG